MNEWRTQLWDRNNRRPIVLEGGMTITEIDPIDAAKQDYINGRIEVDELEVRIGKALQS